MLSSAKTAQTPRFHRSPLQFKPATPAANSIESATLVLIRGLPGSGKSTMARTLAMIGYVHFEADMFFLRDGKYQYDRSRISDAHAWCQKMTRSTLANGGKVVVSNTFTRLRDLEPYLLMTNDPVQVIEASGQWENIHGVPREILENMARIWEPFANSAKPGNTHRMN